MGVYEPSPDAPEKTNWADWLISAFVVFMLAGIPGGIGLTIYFDGGAWWVWTVISIIFFMS